MQYNFQFLYRKSSLKVEADIYSRCPAFTSKAVGTTSVSNQTMLQKDQWLDVEAMECVLKDDYNSIQILVHEVDQLLPEARERIKEKAMLDEKSSELCK